jgi:2-keto-4-pentenoate hydratase/2-oxohepta-3-ene-1,7-dioic acid hydratase in catechol pathway
MIFDVKEIIHQLSIGFTLLPGDIIMTGTPEGVGYAMQPPQTLKAGDVIRCEIDGIGSLTTTVKAQ